MKSRNRKQPLSVFQLLWLLIGPENDPTTQLVFGVPIDNAVVDDPLVACGKDGIQMDFRTINPFLGRIFVKGKAHIGECSVTPPQYDETYSPSFFVSFDDCGMNRLRMLNPRGMQYMVTVILSFHPLFITKVDRAYKISCFYGEVTREVTATLNISMIPTTDLTSTPGMPKCMYSVRRGQPNGPPVEFAQVGDKVFHVWECDSDMYGFLVKECYVYGEDREKDNPVEVLDNRGCTTDPILLNQLTYETHIALAYAESHVFKFADISRTHFQCKIQICLKADGACDNLTPPNCLTRRRAARAAGQQEGQHLPLSPPEIISARILQNHGAASINQSGARLLGGEGEEKHRIIRSGEKLKWPTGEPNELDVMKQMMVFDLDDDFEGPLQSKSEKDTQEYVRSRDEFRLQEELSECVISLPGLLALLVILGGISLVLSCLLCYVMSRQRGPKNVSTSSNHY